MSQAIYVNGRFLTQPLSGVQRLATEMTAALCRHYRPRLVVLAPPGAQASDLPVRIVGSAAGHIWEQVQLPAYAKDGLLLNLGNTAPLRLRSQLVVIHDAGVHATPEAYSRPFRLWYKTLQAYLMRSEAGIVTVSGTARRDLSRNLGIRTGRIAVVSEGADHMSRIAADDAAVARLPPGPFVLAVGNLAAHKNLAALSILAERLEQRGARLVITGQLKGQAFAAGAAAMPQAAHYAGRVSDAGLKALYQAASCLVFPSRYEGFGLPAVEAMACGCPVVASRIPALVETCGEAALYFDPASPCDIAEKVLLMLDNPLLAERARALGRARAQFMTWQRAAGLMADVIDDYLERRAVRSHPGPARGTARIFHA